MFRSKVKALIQRWKMLLGGVCSGPRQGHWYNSGKSFEAKYVHVQLKSTDTTVGTALSLSLFRSKVRALVQQ